MKEYSVLFIDDDSNLAGASADLLRVRLAPLGVNLVILRSLVDLGQYLSATPDSTPVLAIVDIWMAPDAEGGFKALEMLRKKYQEIFVVIYSAHINPTFEKRLEPFPGITIISKPVTTSFLASIVEGKLKIILGI